MQLREIGNTSAGRDRSAQSARARTWPDTRTHMARHTHTRPRYMTGEVRRGDYVVRTAVRQLALPSSSRDRGHTAELTAGLARARPDDEETFRGVDDPLS